MNNGVGMEETLEKSVVRSPTALNRTLRPDHVRRKTAIVCVVEASRSFPGLPQAGLE